MATPFQRLKAHCDALTNSNTPNTLIERYARATAVAGGIQDLYDNASTVAEKARLVLGILYTRAKHDLRAAERGPARAAAEREADARVDIDFPDPNIPEEGSP